ncbi:MAG: hypothetical protein Q7R66_01010 [Undibacterium sp.]|uniref:hypothetical protein n=1 Tax=Undibacterium sp. TaxID=1914977 RepID=UPI00272745B5|nr:hypothetical protein [Undibacterium sp.]MDO8650757.1 hypothetical protein [Undibacterium sp.]
MNKTECINTLRQELKGWPGEVLENTMWACESKFVDGMVNGRGDLEVAASLPQPHLTRKLCQPKYRT